MRLARVQGDNRALYALLERHAVWTVAGKEGQRLICDTCQDATWPCMVFMEVELVLKEVGKT